MSSVVINAPCKDLRTQLFLIILSAEFVGKLWWEATCTLFSWISQWDQKLKTGQGIPLL